MELSAIQTWELENDLQDCKEDISLCEAAIDAGITDYSGGKIADRLISNRNQLVTITKELALRSAKPERGDTKNKRCGSCMRIDQDCSGGKCHSESNYYPRNTTNSAV
jgi:hypothetical protein